MFALSWLGAALRLVPGVVWVTIGLTLVLGSWALLERSAKYRCRAELGEFKGAYTVLAERVRAQNEAVNEWQGAAQRTQAAAEAARRQHEAQSANERQRIAALRATLALPAPQAIPVESRCEAGHELVREGMRK